MKNIIIFGAPGSGKGTYSAELVSKYGLGHISTGDVLRGEIKAGTELGKIAKGYIDNGQLIPDSLMIDILAATYDKCTGCPGVIFDGFPRTIAQAEALKTMLKERGHEMGIMLELVVPEDVLMARLLNRAIEQGRADDNDKEEDDFQGCPIISKSNSFVLFAHADILGFFCNFHFPSSDIPHC